MEASRKVVSKNFWTFLGLFLVMGIGGALAIILTCGVGSLFVAPVIVLTIYCIYIKIFEVK
jgi:4-hydroxybenzoate polyprenyltransferase